MVRASAQAPQGKPQKLDAEYRGDGTYIVGKKVGPIRERWPDWLYSA